LDGLWWWRFREDVESLVVMVEAKNCALCHLHKLPLLERLRRRRAETNESAGGMGPENLLLASERLERNGR